MKKKTIMTIVCLLLALATVFAGCTKKEDTAEATKAPTQAKTDEVKKEATPEPRKTP